MDTTLDVQHRVNHKLDITLLDSRSDVQGDKDTVEKILRRTVSIDFILGLDPHSCIFLTNLSSFVSFRKANKLHHSIDQWAAWVTGRAHISLDTVTKEERFFFYMGQDDGWWGGCLETVAAEHVEEVACDEKFGGFEEGR